MKTGKVKFFNESKGFGFVIDDETGKDYFVHVSGLIDEIRDEDQVTRDEDQVTFELQEGKKGLNAVEVKLA
jgi:CspA family cold shock protein